MSQPTSRSTIPMGHQRTYSNSNNSISSTAATTSSTGAAAAAAAPTAAKPGAPGGPAPAPLATGRLRSDSTRPRSSSVGSAATTSILPSTAVAAAPILESSSSTGSLHKELSGHQANPAPLYTQTNALYGQDTSMTPSVRIKEYSPSLAPKLAQPNWEQPNFNAAATPPPIGSRPNTANVSTATTQQQQQVALPKQLSPGSVKLSLPTAGDLFQTPDQDFVEGLTRDVCGTQLHVPGWNFTRPFLTGLHLLDPQVLVAECSADPTPSLAGLPQDNQEQQLVDDLLYTFMGYEGKYIKPRVVSNTTSIQGPQLGFAVVIPLDPCLQEQLERLLPIPEYVAAISRFVETRSGPEHPLVAQALAAAMRGLLQQWQLLVVQLEHQMRCGGLSLAALVFHVQAPAASLALLAGMAVEAAASCMSSATLLNLLSRRASSLAGERTSAALVHKLLEAAAEPYFRMLELWLTQGELDDPYKEFMIEEDRHISRDTLTDDQQLAYWQHRYVLRRDVMAVPPENHHQKQPGGNRRMWQPPLDVPQFLASSSDAILATGKQLNAIRACGRSLAATPCSMGTLRYDPGGQYLTAIQSALARASSCLMQLMMEEVQLMGWLRSIKHYFLLDQGDVLVHLLEVAQEELVKRPGDISRPRLQSLLELAVRSSSCAGDPHADNLGYTFDPRSIMDLIVAAQQQERLEAVPQQYIQNRILRRDDTKPGWQLLLFTFSLEWPVSLVVSRRQVLQYQLLFKHLFALKYVERQLNCVWADLQQARRLPRSGQECFKAWHYLCSRLTFLVQEVLRHATIDVLEPLWEGLEAAMKRATSMDEVMSCHQEFLTRALEGTLLVEPAIVKCCEAVLKVASEFCMDAQILKPPPEAEHSSRASRSSSTGGAPNRPGLQRMTSCARTRMVLQQVAGDAAQSSRIQKLLSRFKTASDELVKALQAHYKSLLADPAEVVGSSGVMGAAAAKAGGGGSSSSRRARSREELESLMDLIERIDVDKQHMTTAQRLAMACQ